MIRQLAVLERQHRCVSKETSPDTLYSQRDSQVVDPSVLHKQSNTLLDLQIT